MPNIPTRYRPTGRFEPRSDRLYIAFNKPYGVLSQFTESEDPAKRTLAEFGFPPFVYPVGRLDYDSEGLLLMSDDAKLNAALLHPERKHERTYLAQVENIPSPEALEALRRGVAIQGKPTLPARARLLPEEPDLPDRPVPIRFRKEIPTCWLELTLIEGRNRQVRRMTAAVGHPTLRLIRVAVGDLRLADLGIAPGEMKRLSPKEIRSAFRER